MKTREDVIKGLEYCAASCKGAWEDNNGCPYMREFCHLCKVNDKHNGRCIDLLCTDTLALLKAQELCGDCISRETVLKSVTDLLYEPDSVQHIWSSDVLAIIKDAPSVTQKAQEPRLLSADEFEASKAGYGWEEDWFSEDDEEPEMYKICPFAWADGNTVSVDGTSTVKKLLSRYNKRYGIRVWVGDTMPTDEQREATPWEG